MKHKFINPADPGRARKKNVEKHKENQHVRKKNVKKTQGKSTFSSKNVEKPKENQHFRQQTLKNLRKINIFVKNR